MGISIHALLTESDPPVKTVNVRGHDFYPRSPYGERLSGSGDYVQYN